MTQKFHKGDLVHVVKDLGPSMSHFTSDVDAIVIGSYKDQYGGSNEHSYTIHLKGGGKCSWYDEHQLELIEANRIDLLDAWEAEQKAEQEQKSDIDWIFENGPDVAKSPHGASVARLARDVGIDNLWGSRGEGMTYYANSMAVLALALPFLVAKDKSGWQNLCSSTNGREQP